MFEVLSLAFFRPDNKDGRKTGESAVRQRFFRGKVLPVPGKDAFLRYMHREGDKVLCFDNIPSFLKNNQYLLNGYRVCKTKGECFRSIFQWHNETINIWTHLIGFLLFLFIGAYDLMYRLPLVNATRGDYFVTCAGILAIYLYSLGISTIYHTCKCLSRQTYEKLLQLDVVGVGLSLTITFVSGAYYAFIDHPYLRAFYISVEIAILAAVLSFIFHREFNKPDMEFQRNRLLACLVAFALIPVAHWVHLSGGLQSPEVKLLLPRVMMLFFYAVISFSIFHRRFPECLYPGRVDCLGSSHQIWHLFVILAKLWWHETGFLFLQCTHERNCDQANFLSPAFW